MEYQYKQIMVDWVKLYSIYEALNIYKLMDKETIYKILLLFNNNEAGFR